MSRIIQIRRGTTAQNDNFTGMCGELSYDTEAKTLRVHDGETLGGIALARADSVVATGPSESAFDINSVPDEFWDEKFAQFAKPQFTVLTSRVVQLRSVGMFEYIFNNVDRDAIFANVHLVCLTPSAGYAIDDEVAAFGLGEHSAPGINTFIDHNGMHAILMCAHQKFWVYHKDTGEKTEIEYEKWGARFRVCY